MDPATLSAGLVALLAPLLPHLTGIGQAAATAAADRVGQTIGKAAVRRCTCLWDRLWPQLRGQSAAREAVKAMIEDPDAERPRAGLVREIAALLAREPELARETATLLKQIREGGVAVGVGTVEISGDQNVVQFGERNMSIGQGRAVPRSYRKLTPSSHYPL